MEAECAALRARLEALQADVEHLKDENLDAWKVKVRPIQTQPRALQINNEQQWLRAAAAPGPLHIILLRALGLRSTIWRPGCLRSFVSWRACNTRRPALSR
jgi:hypothetical protein